MTGLVGSFVCILHVCDALCVMYMMLLFMCHVCDALCVMYVMLYVSCM